MSYLFKEVAERLEEFSDCKFLSCWLCAILDAAADDAVSIGLEVVAAAAAEWPDWPSTCFLERWRPLFICRSQYFWSATASLEHRHFFPSVLRHRPGSGSLLLENPRWNPPQDTIKPQNPQLINHTINLGFIISIWGENRLTGIGPEKSAGIGRNCRRIHSSSYRSKEISRNRNISCYVLVDQCLMFKLHPLWRSKRPFCFTENPVHVSTIQAFIVATLKT